MTEKVEFGSRGWLLAIQDKFEALARTDPEMEVSICEVFTKAPAHLDSARDGTIAWHCRIAGGKVAFEHREADDVDIKNITDYEAILPFAKMLVGPETMEDYQRQSAELVASGKLIQIGDRERIPASLHGLHNEMAEITA